MQEIFFLPGIKQLIHMTESLPKGDAKARGGQVKTER